MPISIDHNFIELNFETNTYAPTTYVLYMHIIFLAHALHPKPPLINPKPSLYAGMNKINDNFGFSRNNW
jgi:hypothetical protein